MVMSHGQPWMTPELVPPPLLTTTSTGGCLSSRPIQRASFPYTAGLQPYWVRTRNTPAAGLQRYWVRTRNTPATSPLP
ncbi:hypothetical protein TNCV_1774631 [Trichonephila clavipes]|nr:hypothetical protein TNCV_1774631 [Trichonephila clavipes]